MSRVVQRGAGIYPLSITATNDDGVPTQISGPATATVFDGAGVQVAAGDATVTDAGGLTFDLPVASAPLLDAYRIVWSGKVGEADQQWSTTFDLVGDRIITPGDIRAYNDAFIDKAKFPDATLDECCDEIEDIFEQNGQCAFRPRGARFATYSPRYSRTPLDERRPKPILLPDTDVLTIYSVTVDGVAIDVTKIRREGSQLWRTDRPWYPNELVSVHYAYGYATVPMPVRKAARVLAKERVVPSSQISARATATTVGDYSYRLTIAGRDGFTGIPDVDAVINQFGRVRPVL